jgi:hypothetical protein
VDPLVKIERPKQGDDVFKLWQKAAELIDAINDISVTIVPGNYGFVRIEEGDIQFDFNAAAIIAALKALKGGSNPTSGNTDNPGPTGDPTGHPSGCTPADFALWGALCGSIVSLREHRSFSQHGLFADFTLDVADVYDSRFAHNFIGTMNPNLFNIHTVGEIEGHYGIVFGIGANDDIVSCCAGDLPPPACPDACPAAPVAAHYTLYQEDYDPTTFYHKPGAPPP